MSWHERESDNSADEGMRAGIGGVCVEASLSGPKLEVVVVMAVVVVLRYLRDYCRS